MAKRPESKPVDNYDNFDPNEDEIKPFIPDGEAKNFDTWESQNLGFPPFWKPVQDEIIHAQPLSVDISNPEMIRYVLIAKTKLRAFRGPNDEQEQVIVKPDEQFTLSTYATLPLMNYMGHEILIRAKDKRKISNGRTLWSFEVKVPPEVARLLEEKRKQENESQLKQFNQDGAALTHGQLIQIGKEAKMKAEARVRR